MCYHGNIQFLDKCHEPNIEYSNGKSVKNGFLETESAEACKLLCQTTHQCRFFTFDAKRKRCWLKRSNKGKVMRNNFFSGKKYCDEKGW